MGRALGNLTPFGAVVLLAAMANTLAGWADYDIYGHLANGWLIVETGVFPSPDRFSWTMYGHPAIIYASTIDTLYYHIWRWGGARALGVVAAVSYALALLPIVLLVGRMRVHRWVELAALLLVLIATMPFHGARPHLLALAIFNTLLVLLEPPFGMVNALLVGGGLGVWAHMHASFLYGFALLGGAAIAWSLARDVRSVMGTLLALVVGGALSLLTPLGVQTWIYPLTALATPFNLMYNHDWQSLRPLSASGAAMGLLMLVSVLLGISRKPSARAVGAALLLLPAIQYVRLTLFAAPLLMVAALERLIERAPHLRLRPDASL